MSIKSSETQQIEKLITDINALKEQLNPKNLKKQISGEIEAFHQKQSDKIFIRYFDIIRLKHKNTGRYLTADTIPNGHPKSSGANRTYTTSEETTANLWLVLPPFDQGSIATGSTSYLSVGRVILNNEKIRLMSIQLASYNVLKCQNGHYAISQPNFEVYTGSLSTNADWVVKLYNDEPIWTANSHICLENVNLTSALQNSHYLFTDNTKIPIDPSKLPVVLSNDKFEVSAKSTSNESRLWMVETNGVSYFNK